ncbi:Ran-binding-domain-containing protein [Periconia macrospinosa]|uniref:Ran-binding-domain-containing protein n=1 Tax=Periconia macrospinosa TaxID=97972 RepID=A0A2V1DSB0_9PLEO|nr:Ran-binding-domain-containing protein [Periconia macrospinosa]
MEVLLSQVTKQAMNYAIRTGITITSGYAIRQCGRLLKTVEGQEKEELASLRLRLESKIRIISPAIDMIELIAARGNTSLESAVTLTKSLRWDIQSLGVRLSKAVGEAELVRKGSSRRNSAAQNELELKRIISEIKKLLIRIEDAVPLINLAITTSGVNLSTTLPATVSPSRLLQASTFLTAGDSQYNMMSPRAQQIGPTFTLSMYMLFSGHAYRPQDEEGVRETTWKEVMHKARVTLLRVPLDHVYDYPTPFGDNAERTERTTEDHIPSEGRLHEFAYQLLVLEDLDDDRVHTFEDGEAQPGPYEGVDLAGVREIIPIHEISKIFYADTGKILNIGAEGETNNPILLLKRDVNAVPPRRMMEHSAVETNYESDGSHTVGGSDAGSIDEEQSELDAQIRRESTAELPHEEPEEDNTHILPWRLPPNLDLEWMAFEVYTEDPSSDSDVDVDESELDTQSTEPPSSSTPESASVQSPGLTSYFSKLNLRPSTPTSTPPLSPSPNNNTQLIPSPEKKPPAATPSYQPPTSSAPAIKTSLSLLEMLIRLTALQQFQQTPHLAIPDELLTFFLSDSSTVGSGGDADLRRRVRSDARRRVGFDPYDESPIKRRGEDYVRDHGGVHDDDGVEDSSSGQAFDYVGYPHGRTSTYSPSPSSPAARSTTSIRSPSSLPQLASSPILPSRSKSSSASTTLGAPASSASPLLRRAISTQPSFSTSQRDRAMLKQPHFVAPNRGQGPLTAPPTSSSPGLGRRQQQQQHQDIGNSNAGRGGSVPLDTPPTSVGKLG